jgi:GNAT superfamily N-acetyltransferase
MEKIEIKQVQSLLERRKFLTFPWKIYRNDSLWVPPLLPERKKVIDPDRGVFFDRGEAEFFLVYKDGKLAGTICAAEDPPTNQKRGKKECMFGFLEYIEDYEVFQALIEKVREWGEKRGLNALYGPWNLDYEDGYGVLIEGRDTPPALMCGHTPPYYQEFMERYGFQPARAQNVALRINLEDSPEFRRLVRLAKRVKSQGKIVIRQADFENWQEEIDNVHRLLNKALAHLSDHIGWRRDALEATLEPFRAIADPAFILFAEVDGETVGFLPGLPNLNEIFSDVNGLRYPWDILKLFWLIKRREPNSMTIKSGLVLPEYWGNGVAVLLFEGLFNQAIAHGYRWTDMSITDVDNPTSVLTAEKMGAEIYKRWQVYTLPFA